MHSEGCIPEEPKGPEEADIDDGIPYIFEPRRTLIDETNRLFAGIPWRKQQATR